MKDLSNETTFQQQLDRLVDGELAGDDYRKVLLFIESTENGWRECALAFLEAQSFQNGMREQLDVEKTTQFNHTVFASGDKSKQRKAGAFWLGFALTVALIFGASGYMLGVWNQPTPQPTTTIAQPTQSPAQAVQPDRSPRIESKVRTMKLQGDLVVQSGDQQVRVPVYQGEGVGAEWLHQQPSAISRQAIEELTNRGHTVKQTRSLATIPLEDGNYVVAPVDHLEITPVNMHWQ